MGLKPIGDRIIVRREAADEKTAGGIMLPDTAKNKPQQGTVLAVGPGKLKKDGTRAAMQLKAGDQRAVHLLGRRRVQGPPGQGRGRNPGHARGRRAVRDS